MPSAQLCDVTMYKREIYIWKLRKVASILQARKKGKAKGFRGQRLFLSQGEPQSSSPAPVTPRLDLKPAALLPREHLPGPGPNHTENILFPPLLPGPSVPESSDHGLHRRSAMPNRQEQALRFPDSLGKEALGAIRGQTTASSALAAQPTIQEGMSGSGCCGQADAPEENTHEQSMCGPEIRAVCLCGRDHEQLVHPEKEADQLRDSDWLNLSLCPIAFLSI